MKRAIQIVSVAAIVGAVGSAAMALNIETVLVGNPGNADDTHGEGHGSVDYTYNIGKYEVTGGQYCEFLNAVARTDTYDLYHANMDKYGCQITQNGVDGSYTYDFSGRPGGTVADWANLPVQFVTWGDAARFANWLHNGQPTGMQDLSTTEDGSYYLDGATTNSELQFMVREPDAMWVICSEDEWYKAAYHKNDGVTGNYFDYPTGADSLPSNDLVDPDPGNNANFFIPPGDYTLGQSFPWTKVGEFENSDSPYGTFDQGGNVWEWLDSPIRRIRGGSVGYWSNELHAASSSSMLPGGHEGGLGFRVAEVPEPATMSLLVLGGLTLIRRRKRGDRKQPQQEKGR